MLYNWLKASRDGDGDGGEGADCVGYEDRDGDWDADRDADGDRDKDGDKDRDKVLWRTWWPEQRPKDANINFERGAEKEREGEKHVLDNLNENVKESDNKNAKGNKIEDRRKQITENRENWKQKCSQDLISIRTCWQQFSLLLLLLLPATLIASVSAYVSASASESVAVALSAFVACAALVV